MITNCKKCGNKYVDTNDDGFCDSCRASANLIQDEQEIIDEKEVEWDFNRRQRQERQDYESASL